MSQGKMIPCTCSVLSESCVHAKEESDLECQLGFFSLIS